MTLSSDVRNLIERLRAKDENFCIITVIRTADATSARPGAKAVVTIGGALRGFVGGSCVSGAVKRSAQECLQSGKPKMIRIKPAGDVVSAVDVDGVQVHRSHCPSGGTVEIFIDPQPLPRILLICGASPIAQALILLARGLGFRIIVAANKQEHDDMAGADRYLDDFSLGELVLSESDAAIVATQGNQDREALRAVLLSGAGYKGMVCSRKKRQALTQQLVREDADFRKLSAGLHAPAGVHIGAIEPEEIALSVVCEIVAFQRLGATEARQVSPKFSKTT